MLVIQELLEAMEVLDHKVQLDLKVRVAILDQVELPEQMVLREHPDNQDPLAQLVPVDRSVPLGNRDLQEQLAELGLLEMQDQLVQILHQLKGVMQDHLEQQVRLVQLETLDQKEILDN